jgi:hypothetical protein
MVRGTRRVSDPEAGNRPGDLFLPRYTLGI